MINSHITIKKITKSSQWNTKQCNIMSVRMTDRELSTGAVYSVHYMNWAVLNCFVGAQAAMHGVDSYRLKSKIV